MKIKTRQRSKIKSLQEFSKTKHVNVLKSNCYKNLQKQNMLTFENQIAASIFKNRNQKQPAREALIYDVPYL